MRKTLIFLLFWLSIPLAISAQSACDLSNLCPGGTSPAPTVIACANGTTGTNGGTITVVYSPTSGNTLWVFYYGNNNSLTTATLSDGSTSFTQDATNVLVTGTLRDSMWHYANVPAGTTSVAFASTGGGGGQSVAIVCEGTNGTAKDAIDTTGTTQSGATGTWTTNSVTNSGTNGIVWALISQNTGGSCPVGIAATSPYTIPANAAGCRTFGVAASAAYRIVSSNASQSASGTNSDTTHALTQIIGAYK